MTLQRVKMGVSVVLLTGLAACGEGQAGEAPSRTMVEASRQYLEIVAEAAGSLEPLRRVEVMSKASGEVTAVLVDVGDRVEPGTLLARIDPRDVQNDYNQAQADFEVARERFTIAAAQLRRSDNLLTAGVITDQEHESRNLEYANAQAAMVRAETSLDLARVRLDDVTVRSPLVGTVLVRNVEEGQVISSPSGNVSGGTVLLTIADLDVMQVRTLVNETDVGRIRPGMDATVAVDAFQDRTFAGSVEKIEPQAVIEQSVVNFPVIVRLDNREGILKPGMSANVAVLLAERPDALTLPNNAIVGFQELAAAGSVLRVPENRLQMDQSVFQELRRELAGNSGAGGTAGSGEVAEMDRSGPEGGRNPADAEQVRQRIAEGGITPEQIATFRQGMGAGGPGARGAARGGGGDSEARPGVVFVEGADGTLTPRAILVGVTDWSNSEILAGLEEGERVAVLGGQVQQTNPGNRFRGMGGGLPF